MIHLNTFRVPKFIHMIFEVIYNQFFCAVSNTHQDSMNLSMLNSDIPRYLPLDEAYHTPSSDGNDREQDKRLP